MGFREFLLEYQKGSEGQGAGQHEVHNTPLENANKLFYGMYHKAGIDPHKIFPHFEHNYLYAQKLAQMGQTRRVDMPVIKRVNAFTLQRKLARGALDIRAPFSKYTQQGNPFPHGLSGPDAQRFLSNGFRDGKISDDVVKVRETMKQAGTLKPIQYQIYLDKALTFGLRYPVQEVKNMLANSFMISSSDGFIIDGHHRWLFAVLMDPSTPMKTLEIDLPLKVLLGLLTAYGDAIGNKRNK